MRLDEARNEVKRKGFKWNPRTARWTREVEVEGYEELEEYAEIKLKDGTWTVNYWQQEENDER